VRFLLTTRLSLSSRDEETDSHMISNSPLASSSVREALYHWVGAHTNLSAATGTRQATDSSLSGGEALDHVCGRLLTRSRLNHLF